MPTLERWLLALVIALLVGAWHAAYAALYARPLPSPTSPAPRRSHPVCRVARSGSRRVVRAGRMRRAFPDRGQ